eukprot:CAMPEP_0174282298 /NCGR_PEP_ID=MMETSP0809-20121228/2781_1 /TAXON_ID=73025 ORGANISM="Eutreptiella gymnastica-like, Strain CCMP1594" /NCGR_SAMPLE_ID=MMETSP0809 /ASSEMBLY_ACC=CAM_ASM_000658 /LENGTH=34 /DNA_ID= /DNA_START= /DNA_END= /DNA_ORIENTATION=
MSLQAPGPMVLTNRSPSAAGRAVMSSGNRALPHS